MAKLFMLKKTWAIYAESNLDKSTSSRFMFRFQSKKRFFEKIKMTSFIEKFVMNWSFFNSFIAFLHDTFFKSLKINDKGMTKSDRSFA